MNKKGASGNFFRGLAALFAVLLVFFSVGKSITDANASTINTRLGLSTDYLDNGDANITDMLYYTSDYTTLMDMLNAAKQVAVTISEEGSVLFKNNNNALPIAKDSETVTLWGMNSHYPTLGGMIGSNATAGGDQESYGLEEALVEQGFTLNQNFITLYSSDAAKGYARTSMGHSLSPSFGMAYENPSSYKVGEVPASLYTNDILSSADDTVALVVISRDASEAADYSLSMTSANADDSFERPLALSDNEKDMLELAKAHSTRVVVLINSDMVVEIDDLKYDDEIDAILWAGLPGINGFLGVANVLSGDANPSGHISDTYPVNSASAPSMQNFGVYTYTNSSKSTGSQLKSDNKGDWYLVETEGIYVGYKYYETRYEDSILGQGNATNAKGASSGTAWSYGSEVSYPFGYGLSYTTFTQTLDSVEVNVGGESTATVTVTNTGDVAGKWAAQLYVQAPYTTGGIEKSAIQLIAFEKTSLLEPGASETLTLTFDAKYIASYDETATKADGTVGAWTLDAGDYYFALGNGAHEALNNVLALKTGSDENLVKTADSDVIDAALAYKWNLAETDIETYSENVENTLQDMNINNLIDGTATYTTRSDWTKGWETVSSLTATDEMLVGLTNSVYELTENGDGVTWGADGDLNILDMVTIEDGKIVSVLDIDDPKWDELLDQITLDEAIQFIEKGGDDIENIDSIVLPRLYENDGPIGFAYDQVPGFFTHWTTKEADYPTYVAETDEGADYSGALFPTEPVVAATFNKELVSLEGQMLGEEGLWAKETGIIGPGLNIHRATYCARNHEYYSEDSVLTNYMGAAVCEGIESKGMQSQPKHFAFNHQEYNRSGISTFMTEQAAREIELRGFQGAMSDYNCMSVMTAFNRVGTVFAGASSDILINIARNEWGYTGSFVSDMINGPDYMNWRDITFGGGGNALTSSAYDSSTIGTMAASKSAIAKDTKFQEMMKYNIKYWLYSLANSNGMNGLSPETRMVHANTWVDNTMIAGIVVSAILTAGNLGLYFRKNLGKKEEPKQAQ